jgi:hypothetical protein
LNKLFASHLWESFASHLQLPTIPLEHFSKIGGTMDKIRYGKWGGWIATVSVLLRLFVVISAQPGDSTI